MDRVHQVRSEIHQEPEAPHTRRYRAFRFSIVFPVQLGGFRRPVEAVRTGTQRDDSACICEQFGDSFLIPLNAFAVIHEALERGTPQRAPAVSFIEYGIVFVSCQWSPSVLVNARMLKPYSVFMFLEKQTAELGTVTDGAGVRPLAPSVRQAPCVRLRNEFHRGFAHAQLSRDDNQRL